MHATDLKKKRVGKDTTSDADLNEIGVKHLEKYGLLQTEGIGSMSTYCSVVTSSKERQITVTAFQRNTRGQKFGGKVLVKIRV